MSAERSGSHLDREIREQPETLARLLETTAGDVREIAASLRGADLHYALLAARGSSDNAARYAQYLFGVQLGLPVALAAPSLETMYGASTVPRGRHALVIGISQSGRSPDIVAVLASAHEHGAPTVAITNDPDSPLARAADAVLPLGVGEERSVAATKTYTASLLALAALVAELRDGGGGAREALKAVPDRVQAAIDAAFASVGALEHYATARHVITVGRGFNYCTAFEIALKVRELTATVAEGFSPADLMHGPIAAVAAGTPAVVVAPSGRVASSVLETADMLRERGVDPIVVADDAGAQLRLPDGVPEWLSPIVAVVPGQVLALRFAEVGDHAVDAPPGLTKVTETL
jgi:glucosamine--fructose-6-phosphate aminotransferase (isomerizing)